MLARIKGDRWLALGAAVAVVAGAAIVAIWQSKPKRGFWQISGWLAVSALVIGVVLMLTGFFKHDATEAAGQTQIGGDQSANYQAGRDIRMHGEKKEDR